MLRDMVVTRYFRFVLSFQLLYIFISFVHVIDFSVFCSNATQKGVSSAMILTENSFQTFPIWRLNKLRAFN